MKTVTADIDDKIFELIEEKAKRWNLAIPDVARELLIIGVGQ